MPQRRCRICGCTDDEPCYDENLGGTCAWSQEDLCTFCDPDVDPADFPGRDRNLVQLYSEADMRRLTE